MRIAACQPREILDNIDASLAELILFTHSADQKSVDLICFPECFIGGYFQDQSNAANVALDLSGPTFKNYPILHRPSSSVLQSKQTTVCSTPQ
ncbi:nitrilase-related carbon-nitrogen hydrolase [Maritalea sp.]|jgi:predicted amidohydrolase|uniref:nitrilase-related carbon-nitrogen hydrolase n=1 Tax=Maritalea sp. TaxID=2003361 RepID=UPI0039E56A03